jgi:hypothetical protein
MKFMIILCMSSALVFAESGFFGSLASNVAGAAVDTATTSTAEATGADTGKLDE